MVEQYALNYLKCFEVLTKFDSLLKQGSLQSPATLAKVVKSIVANYFQLASPNFVKIAPAAIKRVLSRVNGGAPDAGGRHDAELGSVFAAPREELRTLLEADFLPAFFKSEQYRLVHKHPCGRMWRVLTLASTARDVCTRIEKELADVLESMANSSEMNRMYPGSTGFDDLTKTGAKQLRCNMWAFKDNLELVAVSMQANYAKGFSKEKILATTRGREEQK